MNRLNILDYDYPELANYLLNMNVMRKILLTYYNFNTYGLLRSNPSFNNELYNSFTLHVDGFGAYYFSKILFENKLKHNINGSDLYPVLIHKLICSGKRIFIVFPMLSNVKQIEKSICNFFESNYKSVDFGIYNENCPDELLKKIKIFEPYVVFVGLGQPYQELWVLKNKDAISSNLIVCCGSGLEFLLNQKKRAPIGVQKLKLEWAYRLVQEPKRLWKRYILGIPVFIFHVFVQKTNLMFKKD
ncbi:MAG: WecB/TagA/CpsF family glycosyltransferase [Candidatus Kapaibacterium sp.]